jgi:polyisoprenoid-binding protein YceI
MSTALLALALLLPNDPAPQGETAFYFGTDPARTNITFSVKTSLGNLNGVTRTVSGSAAIDFEGGKGSCQLVVPVKAMDTPVAGATNVMHGDGVLDAEKFPTIEFRSEKASLADGKWSIQGKLTIKGTSKDLTLVPKVIKLPDASGAKLGAGSWVFVETGFVVKLADFGISPKTVAKIEDEISVNISIFGTTAKPAGAPEAAGNAEQQFYKPTPVGAITFAGGAKYRFSVKPQLTKVALTSKTEFDTVVATSTTMAGAGAVDLEKGAGEVKFSLPVQGFSAAGLKKFNEALQGAGCLDSASHRDLLLESLELKRKDGETWAFKGNLTLHGVKKEVSAEAKVSEVPLAKIREARYGMKPGLKLDVKFELKYSDFGAKPPESAADAFTLSFDLLAIQE